jgi:hypothetical protein
MPFYLKRGGDGQVSENLTDGCGIMNSVSVAKCRYLSCGG